MKKQFLLFIGMFLLYQLSLSQVVADSLKGLYAGMYYHKTSDVSTYIPMHADSEYVTFIDTVNCRVHLSGSVVGCVESDTTTFWTSYDICNGIYAPSHDVNCIAYPKFYSSDSLKVFFVTPRPYPNTNTDQHLFLGKRVPGTSNVGIRKYSVSKIPHIFPNPAHDKLYILNDYKIFTVDIYDVTGKKVLASKGESSKILDISCLSKGVYLIRMVTNNEVVTEKFIKE